MLAPSWMKLRQSFLKVRNYNLSLGSVILAIYIFIWTHGEKNLPEFLNELINFHSNLKFTYASSSGTVNVLDLNVT